MSLLPTYTNANDALARLNERLPLAARQAALEPALRQLHQAILRSLAASGRRQSALLAASLGITDVPLALARLRDNDLVVLDAEGEITGAYPITLEETGHRVILDGHILHAMCSVDALAISPMFQRVTRIESQCRICRTPTVLTQHSERVVPDRAIADVHVGIRWQHTHGCAARSLCREMVFFCGPEHAQQWQDVKKESHAVLSLPEAVVLATRFFLPLLS